MTHVDFDVLIVGGGPAGLAAAAELGRSGRHVGVVEREAEFGGIPRHCFHTGFGWFDLRRVFSGPSYALHRTQLVEETDADLFLETSIIGWEDENTLRATSPGGIVTLSAQTLLLATGCREQSRSARLIPGSRPPGVLTTGSLQQLVYLLKKKPGNRAVVVGAEHVSFSAIHTLSSIGTKVAAMVTDLPRHQTYAPFRWLTASLHCVPLFNNSEVSQIFGHGKVEGIEITEITTGEKQTIECDTIVFTGEWIPEREVARLGGLELDPGTKGPRIDTRLATSLPHVFAAGNLLHGAEMADAAALEGRHAAKSIEAFLQGELPTRRVPLQVIAPLQWVTPNAVSSSAPPRDRFVFRVEKFIKHVRLEVVQDDKLLYTRSMRSLIPNRSLSFPATWLSHVAFSGGPITVRLA